MLQRCFYWWALLAGLAIVGWTAPVLCHELKVFATRLVLAQPGRNVVYLSWGHALPADEMLDAESLSGYESIAPDGTKTALPATGRSFQEAEIACEQNGVYQVAASRKPAVFTYVLNQSGQRVLRRGGKKEQGAAKIDYAMRSHQFAKALIVVGEPAEWKNTPVGHSLELLPLDSPKDWQAGKTLRVQVLLLGKPLAGEILTGTYVGYRPQGAWCFAQETDREGIVRVPLTQAGTWVFRVRHRRVATESDRADFDFETYTATLTLEARP